MFQLVKIAANTFREAIREPVYFLMLLGALLLIGHYPWLTLFVFFEQLKLVVDGVLATTMLFSLLATVLCASYTISREMRNGTVLLLLSKPISRVEFVLGKIAGLGLAALLFCGICSAAGLVVVYVAVDQFRMVFALYYTFLGAVALACAGGMLMNFLKGAAFGEHATYAAAVLFAGMAFYCLKFQPAPALSMTDLCKAQFLLFPAVALMSVLAVALATRFELVATLTGCTLIFFLGLMSSHLFAPAGDGFDGLRAAAYAVIPNWQYYWMADAIAVGRHIPSSYVWQCCLYSAAFIIAGSAWAVLLFRNREAAAAQSRQ